MVCGVFYIIRKLLNLDVKNGLTSLIWTYETQVMAESASLTPDHKKLGINLIYLSTKSM
jgi:hypothetical protein